MREHLLEAIKRDSRIHYELASFDDVELYKILYENIFKNSDSIGLNE